MAMLGICLATRSAAGLPPLSIEMDCVSGVQAQLLESELRTAGHAGYSISGWPRTVYGPEEEWVVW